MARWARMVGRLFNGSSVDVDLDDELRHHVDLESRDLVAQGWAPDAARREAYRRFGGVERTKERVRDARGGRLVADLWQDLNYAVRNLRRSRGFVVSAVLVVGIGVGASTAALSTVRAVLLDPLPYPESDRLVRVWAANPQRGDLHGDISYLDFMDWAQRVRTLSSVALYSTGDRTLTRDGEDTEWEIVGVVGDVRHMGVTQAAPPTMYTHTLQTPRGRQSYVVGGRGEAVSLFGLMRDAVQTIDPDLAVSEMLPLASVLSEQRARPRIITAVLVGFATLALVLATLGVYGVLSYMVRGRFREIGLRVALGASAGRVRREIFASGMGPALLGLVAGLSASAVLSRYLESLLFEVQPLNVTTFLGGAALLLAAAAAACAIPAAWAAGVDPVATLKGD